MSQGLVWWGKKYMHLVSEMFEHKVEMQEEE